MLPFARTTIAATALAVLSACQMETPQNPEDFAAERITRTMNIIDDCRASECGRLNLDRGDLDDFSITADMTHVTAYMTSYTDFDDLSDIATMTQLRELHIGASQVSDLSGLSNFPNLTLLHAQDLQVADYDAIAKLRLLQELALGGSDLGDMIFISKLTALRSLNLSGSDINSLEALRRHPSLEDVDLVGVTMPDDISILKTIPNLKSVSVTSWNLTESQQAVIDELETRGVQIRQEIAVIAC